jgi:hypothetical protein
MVGERSMDGQLGFRSLQPKGNAALTWGREKTVPSRPGHFMSSETLSIILEVQLYHQKTVL